MSYFSNNLAPNLFPDCKSWRETMDEEGITDPVAQFYYLLDWVTNLYPTKTNDTWYINQLSRMFMEVVQQEQNRVYAQGVKDGRLGAKVDDDLA